MAEISRNPTRAVVIGDVVIGGGNPIAIQSMTATATSDVEATVAQVNALDDAGADIVRIAVDNRGEAEAVCAIRDETSVVLSVDLQENYRLAEIVAPAVDKIRYNPGHLYHHERDKPWEEKVRYLVDVAGSHDCAIRVGINCGSVDPAQDKLFDPADSLGPMLASAMAYWPNPAGEMNLTRTRLAAKAAMACTPVLVNRNAVPLVNLLLSSKAPPRPVARGRRNPCD